jgi:putative ABC transport system substrate-binding protein
MKRREFITLLGGAAAAWPLAARAQQTARSKQAGVLMYLAENDPHGQSLAQALRSALQQLGWIEGSNLHIVWRWAGEDAVLFRDYAAELVGLAPDLIVAVGTSSVAAVKRAPGSRKRDPTSPLRGEVT